MPEYRVTYSETRTRDCFVNANSAEHARRLVLQDEDNQPDFETKVVEVFELPGPKSAKAPGHLKLV